MQEPSRKRGLYNNDSRFLDSPAKTMSPELAIFVAVVIVIVGWFALGTHVNVRKGHRFLEWLQGGLPIVGEKTTLRWLGSSVVHLQIENAREPFRRVEVLVVLEPRDVPPLWLLSRLRGRRDLLIVRTELRSVPKLQVEILDRQAWSTKAVENEVRQQQWQLVAYPNPPFQAYALPPVVFLLGVYLVYRGLRGVIRRRPKPADIQPAGILPVDGPADPYLAQVEEELRKRE